MIKVAIVGGGWYGCHIASYLKNLNMEVVLFERNEQVFMEASGKNQNRLHLGFHYARDYQTRLQSRDGFNRFIERYSSLTKHVENNIYAIPRKKSLIDIKTYKMIMAGSGIEFEDLSLEHIPFEVTNIVGAIKTKERLIKVDESREFFADLLRDEIRFGYALTQDDISISDDNVTIEGQKFDYVIDATWSKLFPLSSDIFYEPTLLLYYKSQYNSMALTLVDGPLISIYPTDRENIFTLSSVRLTPLGNYQDSAQAEARIKTIKNTEIDALRIKMEEEIEEYLPTFRKDFEYTGPQLSIKTKLSGMEDNRACYVEKTGRVFRVMSGKIDTVFVAAERIVSEISYGK